jgi:predicted dehydrogenase
MITHPSLSALLVMQGDDQALQPFLSYVSAIPHIHITVEYQLPSDLSSYDVVLTTEVAAYVGKADHLERFVRDGGGWLGLVSLSDETLPRLFGAQPGPLGPRAELRVHFHDSQHPLATRLPDAVYVTDRHQPLETESDDTEIILCADWRYQSNPVLVARTVGAGRVACTTLHAFDGPVIQQVLYRLLRYLAGHAADDETLGVGLLGYSPAVGQPHGLGVEATPGLGLRAVCDKDTQRLEQAQQDFPRLTSYVSAEDLAKDPHIDLVIIATPPNTHAHLAVQMMDAGKHVVCEKPLALNQKETAAMVEMAEERGVHLSCYQNRRWDVDYLAIKQALSERLIGDVFYIETFVGGFEHPCVLWHSHEPVSGGTTYDWGSHYLDWVVSLMPDRATAVVGTRHKRVWHDVTNADQERIQVRFAGGQEAEFIHSDIAAVRKPKWYLLGTQGAITGHWQDVTTYEIDPIHYFQQHDIPATEMVPDLTLFRRHHSGQIVAQTLPLPPREPFPFHRNLADHLLTGEPIAAPLDQSVQVVAILEAAARSMTKGGTVEALDD